MIIGVVGLGLIGGSIFKKLSEKYKVIGISRSITGAGITEDYNTLRECELIFVCTPMNKTLEILDKLNTVLDKDTIVSDVCSLKDFVSHKKYNYTFIPSHPMAGTEKSGWDNSFAELFKDAIWAVTPLEGTSEKDINKLKTVIEYTGAEILFTTPKEHDKAAALISHAPLVVAQALCMNIKNNKLAQKLAASGFRDTTRLALSNIEMANDMISINKSNIKEVLLSLQNNLNSLTDNDYESKALEIKTFREQLYNRN